MSHFPPIIFIQSKLHSMVIFGAKEKNDHTRHLNAHLRSVHPDCQLQYTMICILLLLERNLMGKKMMDALYSRLDSRLLQNS
jgi:hypothetical protein